VNTPLKHVISALAGVVLCLVMGGAALASPEARAKKIANAFSDEGFSNPTRLEGTSRFLILTAWNEQSQGGVALLIQRFETPKEAHAACVGAMKRGEEVRLKGSGKQAKRRRVRLKGAANARLLRYAAPDGSAKVAVLVFTCGSETIELSVIGQPTPKGLKRLASKIVDTIKTVPGEGASYSGSQAGSKGGAAASLAPGRVLSTGTGFYVSENEILSNAHVVADTKEVRLVAHDGQRFWGKVAARGTSGTNLDLSLIRVKRRGRPLSLGQPRNLQNVFAYGYGALGGSTDALLATEGRISGRHKGTLITTAHVNPGNSGGPLVDTLGRAVGVVFAKSGAAGDQGVDSLGMVIPADIAQSWLRSRGVRLSLDTSQASGSAPDDAKVREAVVRIEIIAGR
jgi:S1-C subfamily serine protease